MSDGVVKTEQTEASRDSKKSSGRRKAATLTEMLLVLEAVLVVGAFSMFTSPKTTEAVSMLDVESVSLGSEFSEVLVFDGRLYNDRLGTAFEYRVKVAVKVHAMDTDWVEDKAARFSHELHMELDTIWRGADPRHLREVDKCTLAGRIHKMLERWLTQSGEASLSDASEVIQEVVLVPSPGIRINR